MVRVGADIGGTFTDLVFLGQDGAVRATKLLSTPDDVRDGKVTPAAARRDYGVALDAATLAVDEVETARLRAAMRAGVDTARPPLFTQ